MRHKSKRKEAAMSTTSGQRLVTIFTSVMVIGAVLFIALYGALAIKRLAYPYELEWMEGGSVDHVQRVLDGQPLYGPPQVEFIPYTYPPLYYYVSAIAARVFGLGFFPLRLISFSATLICFVLIYQLVTAETKRRFAGLAATGLFAAMFRIGGAWFDLARVDMLFLALYLAAIYLIRFKTSAVAYTLAGILIGLSFLTKQTALIMSVPLFVYAFVAQRGSSLFLIGSALIIIGGSTLWLNLASDNWYSYYIFDLPEKHGWSDTAWLTFWTKDMLGRVPIAFGLALLYFILRPRVRSTMGFWLAAFVGMIGAAYLIRVRLGSNANVLLPAHAIIAVMFGLCLDRLIKPDRAPIAVIAGLACLIQFGLLVYDPIAQIPTQADAAAGQRFIATLSQVNGDVFVLSHGYYATLAGKPPTAQAVAIADVYQDEARGRAIIQREFGDAIRQHRFAAIVLDVDDWWLSSDFDQSYVKRGQVFDDPNVFFPVTGVQTRPESIYQPTPK
jgi:hypothetical protein